MTAPRPIPREAADQALAWLTRLHSGQGGLSDRRAVAAWRAADPAHEAAFREAQALWSLASELEEAPGGRVRPSPRAPSQRVVSRLPSWAALAASLLLVALAGLWQAGWPPGGLTAGAEVRHVALEDGSSLSLDARSAAGVAYTPGSRGVELRRGALFVRVAPAPDRPFAVSAGPFQVTALGTAFEVSHESGGGIRVAVTEHAVAVTGPHGLGLVVKEGERLRIAADGTATPLPPAAPEAMAAWRRNRLVAEDERLEDVAAALADHSHGWIVISDSRLAAARINAVLDLDDTDASLRALQAALPMDIHRVGGLVTILTPDK